MRKFIFSLMAALIITVPFAASAEKLPEGSQYQELEGASVKIGRARDEQGEFTLDYLVDLEGNILSGPYDILSDYSGYPYAQNNDETSIIFDKDGSIIVTAKKGLEAHPPENGVYAVSKRAENDSDFEKDDYFMTLYDYETRKELCTLNSPVFYWLEQQTDNMVITKNGKSAFINKYGELQSDFVYDEIKKRFNPDYVPFPRSYAIVVRDGEEKYIDWDLNEIDLDNYNGEPFITQCSNLYYSDSNPSGYKILESGKKSGIFDMEKNEYVIPLQSEYSFGVTDNNQIIIMKDSLSGMVDFNGSVLIEPQYSTLYFIDDDLLGFSKNGRSGIMKRDTLKTVFEGERDYRPVSDGVLIASYSDYSGEYREYRSDVVNYAGHSLVDKKYATVYCEDGKFMAAEFVTAEPKEIEIDTAFAVINLNGKYLDFDGVIRGDRTLVPMREIVEGLGGTVEWNDSERSVHVAIDGRNIDLTVSSNIMTVAGEEKTLDVSAQIINDKTMLPLRALAEAVGAQVDWDGKIRCVYITK